MICYAVLSIISSFCNHVTEEERVGCFTLFVLFLSCGCLCTMAFPHGAMGWSTVCDCALSGHTHFLFVHLVTTQISFNIHFVIKDIILFL